MSQEPESNKESIADEISTQQNQSVLDSITKENFPIDRYLPIKVIGKGAAGLVLLCKDKVLSDRKVAVKVAHGILSAHIYDYQREAKATSKLSHPYIVKVYDCGITDDGIPFIAMEPIEGESLESYLSRESQMPLELAVSVFKKVAKALEYAHSQGVFHRDLKPSNIILVPSGDSYDIKVIDFGIAYISQINNDPTVIQGRTIAGTPLYMSPDQLNNLVYDACSEVYSLGCIIYRALEGKAPYEGESSLELFSAHANLPVPKLHTENQNITIGNKLQSLIERCLAKEKADRFQSIKELEVSLEDIELELGNSDTEIHTKTNLSSSNRQPSKKLRVKNIALVFIVISAGVAATILFYQSNLPVSQDPPKTEAKETKETIELPESIEEFSINRKNKNWYIGKNEEGEDCFFAKQGSTDKDVEDLAYKDLSKIGRVTIPYSTQITGTGFEKIKDLPIYLVNVRSKSFTDEGMKAVTELKHLAVIVIVDLGKVTEKGFSYLKSAPNLKYVYIVHKELTPKMIAHLAEIEELKELGLIWNTYSDIRALRKLSKLKNLEKLNISATDLKNISFVRNMKSLKSLSLAKTEIDDKQIKYLQNLKLEELDIHGTKIGANSLTMLNKIKSLEKLTVSLNNGITRNAIKTSINLPKCVTEIKRERKMPH